MGIRQAFHSHAFFCTLTSTSLLLAPSAAADEPTAAATQPEEPTPASAPSEAQTIEAAPAAAYPPAAPAYASERPAMNKEDWEKKPEGAYYTGLPLVNSDPDTGFGYGLRLFRFDNGVRTNELFPYRAYESRVFAQFFQTTNGLNYHWVSFDAPFFQDGPHRLKVDAVYDANTAANWFGTGDASRGDLIDPRSGTHYAKVNDYLDAIREVQGGRTYAFYNKYDIKRPTLNLNWEELFAGGRMRAIGGLMVQHVTVTDAEGKTVAGTQNGDDVDATQGSTLLGEQCARGELVGCGGGFNNLVKLALSYDMRDFEPDPNSGYVLEGSTQFGGKATGSADTYVRGTIQARGFWSPFPAVTDLVLAGRVLYAATGGDVPFYSLTTMTLPDGETDGLGGRTTIRGFKQSRFVGRVAALANAELRWTFVDFRAVGQRFGLMLVPFVDAGRTFDRVSDTSLSNYKVGAGAGFRIAWNQATIINADYGVSSEGSALYINFGHPF
jgi:hypothetical protein